MEGPLTDCIVYAIARLIGIDHPNIQNTVKLYPHIVCRDSSLRNDLNGDLLSALDIGDLVDYWDVEVET